MGPNEFMNPNDLAEIYATRPEEWTRIRRQMNRAGLNSWSLLRHWRDTPEHRETNNLTIQERRARKGIRPTGRDWRNR